LFLSIGKQYEKNSPDTALLWYNKTYNTANKAAKNSHSQDASGGEMFTLYSASALQSSGWVECIYKGNYEKAIGYSNSGFNIYKTIIAKTKSSEIKKKAKKGMSACYNNIGNVHREQGNYPKAIEYFLKSLKIDEELGDKKGMSACYNNIGNVHREQGNYPKATEYFLKSLKIKEELADKKGMSACYNNIGIVHYYQGNYPKAIEYYLKSLKIKEEISDKKGMSLCYNNIGNVHYDQGNYPKAIEYYLRALKIKEEIGDKNGMAAVYGNIASLHIALADSAALSDNQRINYLNKAIEYGTKAIKLAQEIKAMPWENSAAKTLMDAYEKLGNNKLAIKYAKILIATNDSMFKEEKTKELAEMTAKYEAEKQQQEIEKQQFLLEKKDAEIKEQEAEQGRQRLFLILIAAVAMAAAVIAVIIFRSLRVTRRQKRLIEKQKKLVDQKNIVIEQKNKDITDSIRYAKRIQEAILTSGEYCKKILPQHFILFKPKDIVSGDFYWAYASHNNKAIWTVAD
ncbi:MAG: tetratricopeptide repeat protein, partial [Bacteroidetes bacterium]|nr:tetratricopeptide repeat protein [Bacteroidota bacterium]